MNEMKLKIRLYGDPALRQVCEPVEEVGPGERMLIQAMIGTMNDHKGVGLAAPQVGINKRIFVMDVGEGPMVFVNPEIVKTSGHAGMDEGCLSIPDVQVNVQRPAKIIVRYMDINNEPCEAAFGELPARVIQHENDHLNGKLIVDFIDLQKETDIARQLEKLEDQQSKPQ